MAARKPKPSDPQDEPVVANEAATNAPEDAQKSEPKRTEHEGGIVSLDY